MSRKRTMKPRWNEQPDLDCTTCAERQTCERAEEGSFCSRWHRREPAPEGQDPNEVWRQGGEVDFEG